VIPFARRDMTGPSVQNDSGENTRWGKIERKTQSDDDTAAPKDRITRANPTHPVFNHAALQSNDSTYLTEKTSGLDLGKEYIARLQASMEEMLSRPRKGTHVTDLVLCTRLRVFREIDPPAGRCKDP
jgi:hypothetical protein